MKHLLLSVLLLCAAVGTSAQGFFNLTAPEVRIDSVLPCFSHVVPLPAGYGDSVYSVTLDYPEFIDMEPADVERLRRLGAAELPSMPVVNTRVGVERRQGHLQVSFVPLVFREGKYQKLVSFKLGVKSKEAGASKAEGGKLKLKSRKSDAETSRYASHSVLATGRWAKISVPETGVYQLTSQLVRRAGFSDINKVRIYGYGGALQPTALTGDYLAQTDDLHEVPTCTVGGRRFFHAIGPVGWSSNANVERTRNPYANYGCYFLTESSEGEPLAIDSAAFVGSFYPNGNDYHVLYEVDDYAWYHTGNNLYDSRLLSTACSYQLPAHDTSGQLTVSVSFNGYASVSVILNDSLLGTIAITESLPRYAKAHAKSAIFNLNGCLREQNTVVLQQTAGTADVRLDYIQLTLPTPAVAPDLAKGTFPEPRYLYNITNQDHHADPQADMVIIIPTTQRVLSQALQLKAMHEELDSLRVNIVPADELFNEFSSGTPDANAYRRYLKMLYDRAETEADMPRYLLLFGDGAWDNRMLTTNWMNASADDYLLCYESDNSFSETYSYVSDDYFALLDDGENNLERGDQVDVGVGRLPATTAQEAQIMVDKILDYRKNLHAGDWQNTLCFMGDDGNNNVHMAEADAAVKKVVATEHPAFNVRKVYWDAYKRTTSSTGFRYPDAASQVKQQMQQGALVMDYCGHGAAYQISHEAVLTRSDFATQTSMRLPLWITASCDIMPFDTHEDNNGETAMLNPRGGCIAFFGTTRTVFVGANEQMNCAFLRYLLGTDPATGRRYTMGDAVRLSKNSLRSLASEGYPMNKLHYSLLGDPALTLAAPTHSIVVDSINGLSPQAGIVQLSAGQAVTVKGHVEGNDTFDGVVTLTVKDVEQTVTCQLNNASDGDGAEVPFQFADRPVTLYNGSDSVRGGRFAITFVLPRDVSYSTSTGRMVLYAVNSSRTVEAHGQNEGFAVGSAADGSTDGIGPSIYCYLNSPSFTNGDAVNTTPYFRAELTDRDGINASGSSVGHDMELVVDGQQTLTFNLNNYFQYDFGDYRKGSVGYTLPELTEGDHLLTFRAWDVMNNASVAQLRFKVVRALTPECFSVSCTHNPAKTSTTFIVNHDRTGSQMDVELQVFDASGRQLWAHTETGVSTDNTYTLDWNLSTSSGRRLQTGVYLYRVLISSDGSRQASKAQKIIIL